MQNIFVGNLAATTTEQNLRELFGRFGAIVSVKVVIDRDSGAPRGFAFVEMSSDSEAQQAIAEMNGSVVDEHRLTVNEARPKEMGTNTMDPQTRRHREHRY
ncbi:MAG TPA: RNA-binding protein [Terriglobales bacterium]